MLAWLSASNAPMQSEARAISDTSVSKPDRDGDATMADSRAEEDEAALGDATRSSAAAPDIPV